ncbi:MAG: hydroxyacid dehydrogenase [Planctomycetes bacterium]|nr:hydroxyacid dehydrogenase [Planctomycetota bacterium]
MPGDALILLDPHPRPIGLIFSAEDLRRLEALGRVERHEGSPAPDDWIDARLPEAAAVIGQTALPKARLDRAPKLRAVCNVEGNFLPNIDYEECHRRNIPVLGCGPAFSPAVAEMALGMALALARGIVPHDAAFRRGEETYSRFSNDGCWLLRGKPLGLIGCGNVGRALLPLLKPFGGEILAHDPWIPEAALRELDVVPAGLDELLSRARVVFVLSAATTENRKGLGAEHFARMPQGSALVLVGRADTVDFDALLDAAERGHLRVAVDVFPEEPLPKDHRARRTPNTILSGHRAGGLSETYRAIGRMVVDDLDLVLRGQPPQHMQRARLEIVTKMRGKPVKQ